MALAGDALPEAEAMSQPDGRAVIGAMLAAWEKEQAWRREFADTMALDTNRLYQQGFADGLGHAIHALKIVVAESDGLDVAADRGAPVQPVGRVDELPG